MPGVNEEDFKSNYNRANANVAWMKVYVIQSKNGIIMKVVVNADD